MTQFHMMDIVKEFHTIIYKIERLKLKIVNDCNIDYKSQDARLVALDSIHKDMLATGMWITALNSLANIYLKNKNEFNEEDFKKSVGSYSNMNLKDIESYMVDNLKLGFVVSIHFKIDNLFQNILRELNALPQKTGYSNLTKAILKQVPLPENGNAKDKLIAFANIRNSLHNNGIHRTEDLSVKIDNLEFNFEKGHRIECASWPHIITLLDANIDILNKILLSNKICSVKKEIKDDFSAGI